MSIDITETDNLSKYVYIHEKMHNNKPIIIMNMNHLYFSPKEKELYINKLIDIFSKASNNNNKNMFSIILLFNQNIKPIKKPKIKIIVNIIKLLKNMYINQLYKCFIVNMPKSHKIIYSLVKPFIGKKTRNKIFFKKMNDIHLL